MNSVRFFMSRHPINLQQIGAGWLRGLFFSPVLHVKHHVVVLADWMTSSVAVASLEPRFFSFCSCAWSGFWEYFFVLFNVAVWVSWKVKIKIRKKKTKTRLSRRWSWNCYPWNEGSSHSFGRTLPHNLSVLFPPQACCSADWVFLLPGLGIQRFFSDIERKNSLQRQLLQSVSGMCVYFSEKTLFSSVFLSA